MSECWWSIEVLDGAYPAGSWRAVHAPALIEAAITRGAVDWNFQLILTGGPATRDSPGRRGVIFEIAFRDSDAWVAFRHLPAVTAALDAVPDPVSGLLIYQGRGGSSASAETRRPYPKVGGGAAPIPEEPAPVIVADLG
jgi:hypothetical protein